MCNEKQFSLQQCPTGIRGNITGSQQLSGWNDRATKFHFHSATFSSVFPKVFSHQTRHKSSVSSNHRIPLEIFDEKLWGCGFWLVRPSCIPVLTSPAIPILTFFWNPQLPPKYTYPSCWSLWLLVVVPASTMASLASLASMASPSSLPQFDGPPSSRPRQEPASEPGSAGTKSVRAFSLSPKLLLSLSILSCANYFQSSAPQQMAAHLLPLFCMSFFFPICQLPILKSYRKANLARARAKAWIKQWPVLWMASVTFLDREPRAS